MRKVTKKNNWNMKANVRRWTRTNQVSSVTNILISEGYIHVQK